MNYKVMQRPMFKMGGKAASQGTGITSGLDEKVNMTDGRANYADGPVTSQDFLKIAMDKYNRQQDAMSGMNNLINMQALQQASNVLGQETSNNPLDILVNFAKQGTSIALPALSARKKLELKMNDPSAELGFAKALKPSGGFGEKVFAMKLRKLGELENSLAELTSKLNAGEIDQDSFNAGKQAIDRRMKLISGSFESDSDIRALVRAEFIEQNGVPPNKEQLDKGVANYKSVMGLKDGGRVERQMGSPMMGEQPMAQAPQMMAAQQDVAMETQQDSGNKVYAMLRSRLPQEVPDEVVQLISYNKEAFADFASIKNQEDVTSFNEKYGVELVIDVATV
jgi:hypothetical protein